MIPDTMSRPPVAKRVDSPACGLISRSAPLWLRLTRKGLRRLRAAQPHHQSSVAYSIERTYIPDKGGDKTICFTAKKAASLEI